MASIRVQRKIRKRSTFSNNKVLKKQRRCYHEFERKNHGQGVSDGRRPRDDKE